MANKIDEAQAISALESGSDWFAQLDTVYQRRRELMFQLVDTLNCSYDPKAAGMFIWAKLPEGASPSETFIDQVLYDKNIFIIGIGKCFLILLRKPINI